MENGPQILETPIWLLGARIAQAVLALIIMAMAGVLMHGAYLDVHGLCVATGLFTWIVVAYNILSEKLPALHKIYNVIAVIALDGFMMILWLATFAATAAKRASFIYNVNVNSCYNDGSLINSTTCAKRSLVTRATLLFKSGQAMMSANAGLGALVWLLFIATFTWTMVFFFKGRKEGRFLFDTEAPALQMETKNQPQAASQVHPVPVQQPLQPQQTGGYEKNDFQTQQTAYQPPASYPPQGQYPQQPYQPAVSPQPTPSPAPAGYPAQELYGQQPQQGYYPPQSSELSAAEGQNPYYPAQSPPPQQYQYPPHPPPQ
ncbi:hypothetical protein V2G26_005989 [Clonostachys chloroleuca]|uniref:MARVEL domain-containing protein n=1 Tax=Clonostachys chloroleuca TaxID=1926264 RepID=A0AA35Q4Y7_9HYPO|nr:unnamed protein product [Clonostachys chloroleuca]